MWTDGLVMATLVGLLLIMIVSIGFETSSVPISIPQCQEVVVTIHQGEETLATCPAGTWLDIMDDNVVCRCSPQDRHQPVPKFITPPSTTQIPKATPPQRDDKGGIEI